MIIELFKFLESIATKEEIKEILNATWDDIKFNRVSFGKLTKPKDFIEIALRCSKVILN